MSKVIWQKAASPSIQPLQWPLPMRYLDCHLIHGSLDPHESAPKWHPDQLTDTITKQEGNTTGDVEESVTKQRLFIQDPVFLDFSLTSDDKDILVSD